MHVLNQKTLFGLLLLVFSLQGLNLCAQTINLDSLKRLAVVTEDSMTRFKSWNYVAHYEVDRNPDVAEKYADSAHTLAMVMRKPELQCKTFKLKALVAHKKNDPTRALHWYDEALENARKYNDREEECLILVNLAALNVESGNLNKALEHYRTFKSTVGKNPSVAVKNAQVTAQVGLGIVLKNQNKLAEAAQETKEGLELAKRYGYTDRIWDFYDNLGVIYGRMGDYQSKLEYQRKALYAINPNNAYVAVLYNNLANAFLKLNMSDSAAYYFQKAADDPRTKWKSLIHTYNGLSQVYFEKGRYSDALAWSDKALPLADKTGNAMTIVSAQFRRAKALMGLKRYQDAIDIFNRILVMMDANKDFAFVEERSNTRKYLAQAIALRQGTPEVADLIDAFAKGRDSIHNFVVTQAVEEMRIRYETQLKEDSLRILQMEHRLEKAKTTRYQLGLIGGLLLALSLAGLLFYFLRQRRLEAEILQRQNEELRRENGVLFAQMLQIEQSAAPRTLHDFANTSVVLNGNEKTVFRIGDIFYIQSQGNGVQVCTPDGRSWRWQTMRNLEEALPSPPFLRVHRSYLINAMHIRQYRSNQLTLSNGDVVPVGATQTPRLEAFLKQWLPELA